MKGFALGLALKQRRKATRKSPIVLYSLSYLPLERIVSLSKHLNDLNYLVNSDNSNYNNLLYMSIGGDSLVLA